MKRTATADPTPPSRNTFDVVTPPTRAPRVAWHDAHLRPYGEGLIPDAACQAIPLEAFGPVASLDRQRYFTHDNGGRPYLVRVDAARRRATVRRNLAPGVRRGARYVVTYDKVVKRVDYVRFWNGYAPFNNSVDYDGAIGNTLLFEVTRGGAPELPPHRGDGGAPRAARGAPADRVFLREPRQQRRALPLRVVRSVRVLLREGADGAEVEYTDLARVAAYVKTGDIASLFYGHRDWVSGAYTYAMKKKQRAALAALPRETLRARAIHTRSAGV